MSPYTAPLDALVATLVARLDDNQREMFEERAAIREHDGLQSRALAEALAVLETLSRWPAVLTGLSVLAVVELDGATHCLLTSDLVLARQHLAGLGGIEIAVLDLTTVVREQYAGVAMLGTRG